MAFPASAPTLGFATQRDLPAIADFLPALGGPRFPERFPRQTLADFLDWKYFQNPHGEAVLGIAAEGGRIVGLVAATPKSLDIDGVLHAVYELGDFLTDNRYRGRGIFSQLTERVCAELARRQAVLAYVRPNENSFPILIRHARFVEARQIDGRRFVFPSDLLARKLFRRAAWFGILGLDQIAVRWALAAPRGAVRVNPIERFGPAHDQLWQRASPGYRLAIVRRSAYLNWRYADSPTPFRIWHASRGAEAVGFLTAFVSPSTRTGHIADLFTAPDDDDACAALLGACFRSLRQAGVGSIYCWCLRGDPASAPERALVRACPLSNKSPLHFAVRILDRRFAGLPPSGWQLSMGDFDGV